MMKKEFSIRKSLESLNRKFSSSKTWFQQLIQKNKNLNIPLLPKGRQLKILL